MLWILFGIASGALLADRASSLGIRLFALGLGILFGCRSGKKGIGRHFQPRAWIRFWCLVELFAFTGARESHRIVTLASGRERLAVEIGEGGKVTLGGRVVASRRLGRSYSSVEVSAARLSRRPGRLESWRGRWVCRGRSALDLVKGSNVSVTGRLHLPGAPRNPHGFDEMEYADARTITAWIDFDADGLHLQAEPTGIARLPGLLEAAASRLEAPIDDVLPPRAGALLRAALWGDRTELPPDLREALARLGLSHLIALSGLHLGLILALAYAAAAMVTRSSGKRDGCALLLAAFYTAITGFRPSLMRAFVMLACLLGLRRQGRRSVPLEALCAAGIVSLLIDPSLLFDLGFQFSMTATLGILLLAPGLHRLLSQPAPQSRMWTLMAGSVAVSASSQVFLLPLQVHHFSMWNPLSPCVNAICVPLFSLPLILGFLGNILYLVAPPVGGPLLLSAASLFSIWLEIVDRFRSASPPLTGAGPLVLLSLLPAAGLGLAARHGKRSLASISTVLLLLLFYLAGLWSPQWRDRRVEVPEAFVFDVGQGDATFIRWPDGSVDLVDGGPGYGMRGSDWNVLLPFLKGEGHTFIDRVMLTHAHRDHYGGLARIPFVLRTGSVLLGAGAAGEWIEGYTATLNARGVSWKRVSRGDTLAADRSSNPPLWGQRVVWPVPRCEIRSWDPNDRSIVTEIWWPGGRMLMTGDLERRGEEALLQLGDLSTVTVLKVGHHGSRTSTSAKLLDAIRPAVALISCGRGNRFGHPHPSTLARLDEFGVRTLRTDENGCIRLTLTETGIEVVPWRTGRPFSVVGDGGAASEIQGSLDSGVHENEKAGVVDTRAGGR